MVLLEAYHNCIYNVKHDISNILDVHVRNGIHVRVRNGMHVHVKNGMHV